jgi:hypothetical protein
MRSKIVAEPGFGELIPSSTYVPRYHARVGTFFTYSTYIYCIYEPKIDNGAFLFARLPNTSGIRCLLDPWIRDPGWVKNQDPDPG